MKGSIDMFQSNMAQLSISKFSEMYIIIGFMIYILGILHPDFRRWWFPGEFFVAPDLLGAWHWKALSIVGPCMFGDGIDGLQNRWIIRKKRWYDPPYFSLPGFPDGKKNIVEIYDTPDLCQPGFWKLCRCDTISGFCSAVGKAWKTRCCVCRTSVLSRDHHQKTSSTT